MDALQSQTPTVAHQLRTVDLRSDEHAVETKRGRHGSAVRSPTAHLDLRWCAQETFNRSIDAVISRVRSHRDLSECFGMSQRLCRAFIDGNLKEFPVYTVLLLGFILLVSAVSVQD